MVVAGGAAMDLNDVNQTVASLSSTASNATVYLGGAGLTVGDSTTTTFSGMISDRSGASNNTGGNLIKVGTGTLILSGSNTYGGGTNVDAGTLTITSNFALPDGTSLSVGAGSTFVFDPSAGRLDGDTGGQRRGGVGGSRTGNAGASDCRGLCNRIWRLAEELRNEDLRERPKNLSGCRGRLSRAWICLGSRDYFFVKGFSARGREAMVALQSGAPEDLG